MRWENISLVSQYILRKMRRIDNDVLKRGSNIVSQPEAGENEQPDPTCQLREPTGIPDDDRTEQKSPIGMRNLRNPQLGRGESVVGNRSLQN